MSSTTEKIDEVENEARMLRGELYHAFMPKLTVKRNRQVHVLKQCYDTTTNHGILNRCHHACHRFNVAGEASRRKLVELWRE